MVNLAMSDEEEYYIGIGFNMGTFSAFCRLNENICKLCFTHFLFDRNGPEEYYYSPSFGFQKTSIKK